MSDDADRKSEVRKEIEDLIRNRYLEALVVKLQRQFKRVPQHVEDAVAGSVKKAVESNRVVATNLRSFLLVVARNELIKVTRKQERSEQADLPSESSDTSPEHDAIRKQMWIEVKCRLDAWENERVRTVTLLFLEAAYYGEPLTLQDAARHASEILGEEISLGSVGTWKKRGLARLATEFGVTLDETPERSIVKAKDKADDET